MSEAQTDAMSLISNIAISGHTDSKESICEMVYDTSVIQSKSIFTPFPITYTVYLKLIHISLHVQRLSHAF